MYTTRMNARTKKKPNIRINISTTLYKGHSARFFFIILIYALTMGGANAQKKFQHHLLSKMCV